MSVYVRPPFIVGCAADARDLLTELTAHSMFEQRPVGFDYETLGCIPEEESPVERARAWCAGFAWGPERPMDFVGPMDYFTAWVPAEHLPVLKPWLEDHRALKATTNGFGYERHVAYNHGVQLRGIWCCTSAMSRLSNPGKNGGHGLKAWGERLGYDVVDYKGVVGVARQGTEQKAKVKRVSRKKGAPAVECGPHSIVHWDEPELDWVWANKPERRPLIIRYSVQDACMSLDSYWVLRRKLEALRWAA